VGRRSEALPSDRLWIFRGYADPAPAPAAESSEEFGVGKDVETMKIQQSARSVITVNTRSVPRLKKLRVLIADDYQPILNLVQHLLAPRFEIVGLVADGESLLDAARRLEPDVIVTDISMPLLSGLEAAHELAKSPYPPKLIFLTMNDEPCVVDKALSLGASGYVFKSRLMFDLEQAIDTAMRGEIFVSPTLRH
jgi:CheY-like chemotaxis protein